MSELIVVEFQGFKDNNNSYVVKELALGALSPYWTRRYLFKPPYEFDELDRKVQISNNWCSRNLHGLRWEEGDLDYSSLESLLKSETELYGLIVTKGAEKKRFLESLLGKNVIDMDVILPLRLSRLSDPKTKCNHIGLCAVKNVEKLLDWWNTVGLVIRADLSNDM